VSFISAYCSIQHHRISRNDAVVLERPAASLESFFADAYEHLQINYPKFYKMDNLSKAGVLATEVLLKGRSLKEEYSPSKIAVILSNASASLDTDLKYEASTNKIASPALFVYTLPNIVMGEICIRQRWKGENGFFIFDKFDPFFMASYVDDVLKAGADACLAGWVEILGEQHDVFLYLVENKSSNDTLPHSAAQLTELYQKALWTN